MLEKDNLNKNILINNQNIQSLNDRYSTLTLDLNDSRIMLDKKI